QRRRGDRAVRDDEDALALHTADTPTSRQRLQPPAAFRLGPVVDLLAVAEAVEALARLGDVIDVAPRPAVHEAAAKMHGDGVVAGTAVDGVVAVRAVDEVVAAASEDAVVL